MRVYFEITYARDTYRSGWKEKPTASLIAIISLSVRWTALELERKSRIVESPIRAHARKLR